MIEIALEFSDDDASNGLRRCRIDPGQIDMLFDATTRPAVFMVKTPALEKLLRAERVHGRVASMTTLCNAYEKMGRDFSDEHGDAILKYLAEKPKGQFGVHKYTPEEWDFTAKGLREQLVPQIEYFGVELE